MNFNMENRSANATVQFTFDYYEDKEAIEVHVKYPRLKSRACS